MLCETLNKLNKLLFSIMLPSTFIFPCVLMWANVYEGLWECNTIAIEKRAESGNITKVTCTILQHCKEIFEPKMKMLSLFSHHSKPEHKT